MGVMVLNWAMILGVVGMHLDDGVQLRNCTR